jgi:Uma2 family endonuclease
MRLLTIADLAAMPTDLPSGPVDYELDNGRIVVMSPTGRRHGEVHSAIAAALHVQGQQRGHGKAYVETGVILWRSPDRMVGPDASFVCKRSLPERESPEGFLETIPELVVEIRSKNDSIPDLEAKVADYLRAGVQLVWVVDPDAQTVAEHRHGASPKTLGATDFLRCDDLIPGFCLSLDELFRQ